MNKEPAVVDIRDPLSLVQLRPQVSLFDLLEGVAKAREYGDLDQTQHLLRFTKKCADKVDDLASIAMTHLYLTELYFRYNKLAAGSELATRATETFGVLGDLHNAMVGHLLIAKIEKERKNAQTTLQAYYEARDLCRRLLQENRATVQRKRIKLYQNLEGLIDAYIWGLIQADQAEQAGYCLEAIPILSLSEEIGASLEHSNVVSYVTAGSFLIEGNRYDPLSLRLGEHMVELKTETEQFALPVPENGRVSYFSVKGDYVLVCQEKEKEGIREGPGVFWTGEEWIGGQFKYEGSEVKFESSETYIIGNRERGSVIALLKPRELSSK